MRREKLLKRVANTSSYDSYEIDYDDEAAEVRMTEWTKNKKPISCPWVRVEEDKYDFDITKADQIFDMLLAARQLQLSANHTIPWAKELKKRKYCKCHNSMSHNTNDCKVFRQHIQSAVAQGRIKFEAVKKPMRIEGHPFPHNMVDINLIKGKAKVLTSAKAKEYGAVDPWM